MSKKRMFEKGCYYHLYNRSIEKQKIFYNNKDYIYFYKKLQLYKERYKISLVSYCFLPNHFHLLIKTKSDVSKISQFISVFCSSYALRFNKKHERSGHVWQGRFKSKQITSEKYLNSVIAYIILNPLKHGLVGNISDWPYTSYHDHDE